MKDSILISVIVPVYGVEEYIEGCMKSVINQTFKDFELILVDDGCKDTSIAVAKQALVGSGIDYIVIKQENQGQGIARETGVMRANGAWIIFLDADDTIAPQFLETLLSLVHTTQAEVAIVHYKMVNASTRYDFEQPTGEAVRYSRDEYLYRFLIRKTPPILPAMITRKKLFDDNGIRVHKGCRFSEDIYIMWKIFAKADGIVCKPDLLYNYLVRPNSTMTASKKESILTGYMAMQELADGFAEIYDGFSLRQLILPRWVLGALRSTAKISSYSDFCYVAEEMDAKKNIGMLTSFPTSQSRVLAQILLFSRRLFFCFVRLANVKLR